MDNIKIAKISAEDDVLKIEVTANSEFISAKQFCYIQSSDMEANGSKIFNYSYNYTEECYVEFGKKAGDFTPAFSLKFLKAAFSGEVQIEVDIEVDDNESRLHRASFYVQSELGLIEQFGLRIKEMAFGEKGEVICLN